MKAHVNQDDCIGCGLCADTCPQVFRMDDAGLAEAYAPVSPELAQSAQEAVDSCPTGCISIDA